MFWRKKKIPKITSCQFGSWLTKPVIRTGPITETYGPALDASQPTRTRGFTGSSLCHVLTKSNFGLYFLVSVSFFWPNSKLAPDDYFTDFPTLPGKLLPLWLSLTVWRQDCFLYKMWDWELLLNPAKNTGLGVVRWRLWLQNFDCWTQGMRYPVIYIDHAVVWHLLDEGQLRVPWRVSSSLLLIQWSSSTFWTTIRWRDGRRSIDYKI